MESQVYLEADTEGDTAGLAINCSVRTPAPLTASVRSGGGQSN
jgi:hypothetical protein